MVRKILSSRYSLVFSFLFSILFFTPLVHAGSQGLSMKLKSGKYFQNANNFYIIFDKSGSMGSAYNLVDKIVIEKSLVSKFNRSIPNLSLNAGLRTFGQNLSDFDVTKLEYGVVKYDSENLDGVINKLGPAFGNSPLDVAILAAGNDLKSVRGKSALVIFTDGVDMDNTPVKAATSVKNQYGDNLCIYTVQIGDDEQGGKLLNRIIEAGKCGISTKGANLTGDAEMDNFVERIFLAGKSAKMPLPVQETIKASEVEKGQVTLNVEFDTGKSVVKPKYYNKIRNVAEVMKKNPDLKMVIEGHTDNVGGERYNLNLSQKRAEAIKSIMVTKFNIEASRLMTNGFGYSKPVASNSTKEGRQKNRRVDVVVE